MLLLQLTPVVSIGLDKTEVKLYQVKKGHNSQAPTLLLLSGPTDNWHSDLAWWILGQNYLAQDYSTLAIERAGQGFSEPIKNPSYTDFGQRLRKILTLQKTPVIIVAFASSNLSVRLALRDPIAANKVRGVVLLDPDVLTVHSIEHYTGESENFRKNWDKLEAFIASGKYQERIQDKIAAEKADLDTIISDDLAEFMDWQQYHDYELLREKSSYQIRKFKEITAYKSDLENAKLSPIPKSIPVVILDSDFETGYLEKIQDDKFKQSISQWRDEGKQQFFAMAQGHKCSAYWPVDTQEHLLMFTHPQLIEAAVRRLINC